jgi:KDO2-lipid IV(A) lauroyltransferase
LGEGLGWFAGAVIGIRRHVIDANLRRAFPDRSLAWRTGVARRCHRHFGREAVATVRLSRSGAQVIANCTEVRGFGDLTEAHADGEGVIVVTGHMGNWEIGGAAVASRGVPLDVVVRGQRNRLFDDALTKTRGALGMQVIPQAQARSGVLRSLRRGRVVALVADQDAGGSGLFLDFLGHAASTARGPALFALRTGAPLFLGVSVRERGFPQRYTVHLDRIPVVATGDRDSDVRATVAAYTEKLEARIREHPEQYFWHHRRWKSTPPSRPLLPAASEEPAPGGDVLQVEGSRERARNEAG